MIVGGADSTLFCVLDRQPYFRQWGFPGIVEKSIREWYEKYVGLFPNLKFTYLPQEIYHLYHGTLKNRGYMSRLSILSSFDPYTDVKVNNGAFVWASNKTWLHQNVRNYFLQRNEDENSVFTSPAN